MKVSPRAKVPSKTKVPKQRRQSYPFPIVGIGASAGGLEAFTDLLQALPLDTGMAFILVQHLDPSHGSLAPEILSRATRIPVMEVKDGARVMENNIYIIPPNRELAISNGVLSLLPRRPGLGGRQTGIDLFFQSLAEDQKGRAIGVVLSGTASDGTAGLKAIKSEGGLAIAQDPGSAKYRGMPESAIASGVVDLILAPKEIAKELARISKHPYISAACDTKAQAESGRVDGGAEDDAEGEQDEFLRKIFVMLRKETHVDFSNYKMTTIMRRIQRRMMVRHANNIGVYAKYILDNPNEIRALYSDILIHVTEFFRDPDSYEMLTERVFPRLLKNRDVDRPVRVWVPGCSTGEEAYSLAIVLLEFMERERIDVPIQIFATDISDKSIQKARAGVYSVAIERAVNKRRLEMFFEKVPGGYKINKSIRDVCLFSKHDVTVDPPFSRLDLVSCRNVLIYFGPVLQRRVLPTFHYALNSGGFLWLGRSEGVGGLSKLFSVVDKAHKIFEKVKGPTPAAFRIPFGMPAFDVKPVVAERVKSSDFQRDAERVALNRYSPPSVVINADMEVLKFQGRTGPYLEPAAGLPSNALLKLVRPELLKGVRTAVETAIKNNAPVSLEGLSVFVDGKRRQFSIEVVPAKPQATHGQRYFVIFFEDTSAIAAKRGDKVLRHEPKRETRSKGDRRIVQLEEDLSAERQARQSMMEEFEASQEELTSANEELQSANEELQSTNEELETAKEELQSSNEELNTVNDELQSRNADLTVLSSDLNNVLTNVEIPIVMVGNDLRIRRFTPRAEAIFNLIPGDVGRPLSDLKPNFEMSLDTMVTEVIRTLGAREREVQLSTGDWMRVTVRPYKAIDNRIDGAVISMVDITLLRERLSASHAALKYAGSVADTLELPLAVLDEQLHVLSVNKGFAKVFDLEPQKEVGADLMAVLGGKGWKNPILRQVLLDVISCNRPLSNYEVEHEFRDLGTRILRLNARQIKWQDTMPKAMLLSLDDITERRMLEQDLAQSEERFRLAMENAHDAIVIVNSQGSIEFVNRQALALFGYAHAELYGKPFENLIPPKMRERHPVFHKDYFRDPQSWPMATGRNLILRRKDGSEVPVEISLSSTRTSGKSTVTAMIRDISERNAVEKERTQLLVNERKTNQAKDDFLATLSHELRTPLTTILGWAQELRSVKNLPQAVDDGLSIIEQGAKVQGQLIDDLLDISRIHAGKLSINVRVVDLVQVIDRAVNSVRRLAGKKSISVEVDVVAAACMVLADEIRIQQVFWNLLANAIKFTPSGGRIFVKLTVVESRDGRLAQVQVRDTGMGIKAEFLPKIFERFSQEDNSMARRYGGLGLGLALVKSLIEMQDGTVAAESQGEGKGATFTVRVPIVPVDNIPIRIGSAMTAHTAMAGRLTGVRILVVDDDVSNRELFAMMLNSAGAEIRLAESADEALKVLTEFKPSVLVSDVSMPMEDGYSLIRKIRALTDEHLRKIPAIALTAYASAEDVRRALDAGFSTHVSKPVEKATLLEAISRLVSQRVPPGPESI